MLHNAAPADAESMAKFPGLQNRAGNWTLRVRVPDMLREKIGKREIWRSFGAIPHREAIVRAREARTAIDRLFQEHRDGSQPRRLREASDGDFRRLARGFFAELERDCGSVPLNSGRLKAAQSANIEDLLALSQGPDDPSVQQVANRVLQQSGLSTEDRPLAFLDFCAAIHRALVEHHERQADRLALRTVTENDPLFSHGLSAQTSIGVTLNQAIEQFLDAPERRGIAPKTRSLYRGRLAIWSELLGGNLDVAHITRRSIREAWDVLLKLPPNSRKRFPNLSLETVASQAAHEGRAAISPKNAQLHADLLSGLFKWCVEEEIASRNPALGLRSSRAQASSRRPFEVAELNALFHHEGFAAPESGWTYWLPRIALFSGMRLGEIAGLKRSEIVTIDDIHLFDIKPNEFRTLKNGHSARRVPIHSRLVGLGLLQLARNGVGDGLLFGDLPRSTHAFTHAAQKAIGRRVAEVTKGAVVFHSLRHNFRDATREARLPREIAAHIGGWKTGQDETMDGYGRGPSAVLLTDWMNRIDFPGLVLS